MSQHPLSQSHFVFSGHKQREALMELEMGDMGERFEAKQLLAM
jgi:hypothetical protein